MRARALPQSTASYRIPWMTTGSTRSGAARFLAAAPAVACGLRHRRLAGERTSKTTTITESA